MRFFILSLAFLVTSIGIGQQITHISNLDNAIEETSGLIFLNGKFITHNDSGGAPELYEFDSITGAVTRTVTIANSTNTDWEDLSYDANFIYIADFGNNSGSRTDLKVYRIGINDYFSTANDTVFADTINFSYADQTDFTPSTFSTNFDAEALISFNDSLFIFTKNWGNDKTNIYYLPKTPGTHQINKIDSIDTEGLVTGGCYDSASNSIHLIGYKFTTPFYVKIESPNSSHFSSFPITRTNLSIPSNSSYQMEAISTIENGTVYITAESNFGGPQALFRLIESSLNISETSMLNELKIAVIDVYDFNGQLIKTLRVEDKKNSGLVPRAYLFRYKTADGFVVKTEKVIIQ